MGRNTRNANSNMAGGREHSNHVNQFGIYLGITNIKFLGMTRILIRVNIVVKQTLPTDVGG
eukprot:89012-Pleurochrysis_carterae.AAC.1